MGTIVAARTARGIAIATDCLNSEEEIVNSNLNNADACISKFGESFIGLNCSYAMQQASQASFDALLNDPISDLSLSNKALIRQFFSALFNALRIHHHLIPQNQPNIPFETFPMNSLVVNRHGIFKVDATRSVYEHKKYWAIGSGEAFALGALHALYQEDMDVETLLRSALKTCATFEANRSREVIVRVIPLPNLKLAPDEKEKEGSGNKGKVLIHRGPVSIRRGKKLRKKDGDSE